MENLDWIKKINVGDKRLYISDLVLLMQGSFNLDSRIVEDYLKNRKLTGVINYSVYRNLEDRSIILTFDYFTEIVYSCHFCKARKYKLFKDVRSFILSNNLFYYAYDSDVNRLIQDIEVYFEKSNFITHLEIVCSSDFADILWNKRLSEEYFMSGLSYTYESYLRGRILTIFSSKYNRVLNYE